MRLSCNGCRVLRKGCSESCVLRPCLQWIRSPESQANATAFLAKFYGRTGLINLICNGPEHLRPAMFRSLLYDACGRMLDPIFGSVGLAWSGNWAVCQSGVESILQGNSPSHVVPIEAMASELHRVKAKDRFKRVSRAKPKRKLRKSALINKSHIVSTSKSDGWYEVTNSLQRAANNGKSSTELQPNEFVTNVREEMEYCHDLIWNLETSHPETEAPCNAVKLELTLGYQGSTSPTRILLADNLRCREAHSNQFMERYQPWVSHFSHQSLWAWQLFRNYNYCIYETCINFSGTRVAVFGGTPWKPSPIVSVSVAFIKRSVIQYLENLYMHARKFVVHCPLNIHLVDYYIWMFRIYLYLYFDFEILFRIRFLA